MRILADVKLARDGQRGAEMVAGDHLDRNARRAAFGDSCLRFLARRVDETHQAQKLDAASEVIEGDAGLARRQPLHRETEQPFAMIGRLRNPLFPVSRIDAGDRHHFLRRTLEEDHMLVSRARMERRHEAVGGIERDFVQPLPFGAKMIGVEAGFHRQRYERAFHRIAVHFP
ncbi:hypothetical protein D9M73_144070 [compost metagenome]